MTTSINAYRKLSIPTDPRDGGALDWFDKCDSDHCVLLFHFGSKVPGGKDAREQWLIKALRNTHHQHFFFYPNAHRGMELKAEVVATQQSPWPQSWETVLRIPLAHIFGLPHVDPAQELAQMREFFTFIDTRGQGQRSDGGDALLQWFRGGYGNRGLEWAGFDDDQLGDAAKADLEHRIATTPWLQAWKAKHLKGVSRIRLGPHCWFPISSLVADRLWHKTLEEVRSQPPMSDAELGI